MQKEAEEVQKEEEVKSAAAASDTHLILEFRPFLEQSTEVQFTSIFTCIPTAAGQS